MFVRSNFRPRAECRAQAVTRAMPAPRVVANLLLVAVVLHWPAVVRGQTACPATLFTSAAPSAESRSTGISRRRRGSATRIDKWFEVNPGDNVEPKVKNVGYLTYDEQFFYAAFEFEDARLVAVFRVRLRQERRSERVGASRLQGQLAVGDVRRLRRRPGAVGRPPPRTARSAAFREAFLCVPAIARCEGNGAIEAPTLYLYRIHT